MKDLGLLEMLRYALSGGIGMAVLFLTYPAAACRIRGMDATKETTLVLGVVLLIGTLIYNVHRALVYPIFQRILGTIVRDWKFDWKKWWRNLIIYLPSEAELSVDRWRWEHSEKDRKRWDEWGAQIHSLYCAAWAIILALKVGGRIWGDNPNCPTYKTLFCRLFCIVLIAGILGNYRLMCSLAAEIKRNPNPKEEQDLGCISGPTKS